MSLPWFQRKTRLSALLKSRGDEDAEGLALDRILHGQSVIGKTAKTTEIDAIRFQDKDLVSVGTLEYGQFGVIDVVTCRLNGRVYVRKSTEKRFAIRTRDQCFPQFERDILLQAAKTDSQWAPRLLCSFQTPTHLNLVMDYAEGGTLWDVLESSPHDGKLMEGDLMWWTPQIVSAIHWCHSQGFTHRDIKPHNLVLTPDAHILLIDFGSAAPLLPPSPDGSQCLPKRYCLVPCGTCDYISPEILKAHEEALVALEMEDSDEDLERPRVEDDTNGYGRETDWWSLGVILYEMAYGFAPFFAKDIRQTYLRIMDHEKSLRFDRTSWISTEYQDFLRRLLTYADRRLGRRNIDEITSHPVFNDVHWKNLPALTAPPSLHLPQFTYAQQPQHVAISPGPSHNDETHSQGFAFSVFFQSSQASSPGLSILRSRSSLHPTRPLEEDSTASFIGFSWGPALDAFPAEASEPLPEVHTRNYTTTPAGLDTPRPMRIPNTRHLTPNLLPTLQSAPFSTPRPYPYSTPIHPGAVASTPFQTLTHTSTARRTSVRRPVSDREAMKQLVDCVGMSARKKVLESGRKPRILTSFSFRSAASGTLRKELRFHSSPIPVPDYGSAGSYLSSSSSSASTSQVAATSSSQHLKPMPLLIDPVSSGAEDTDSEGAPPSPSPTPRPGSAMSMMSRRSGTPTVSSMRIFSGSYTHTSTMSLGLLNANGRPSTNLSFSRELSSGEGLSLHTGEEIQEDGIVEGRVVARKKDDDGIEEMEERLAWMMREISEMEERVAEVARMLVC